MLSPTLFSRPIHLESWVTQWRQVNKKMSVPAKNSISLVACYSSDLSGFVFTQKEEYWNLVSFILGDSFNYWATAEQGYQQQLFLQLCFKLKEWGMASSMGKNKKAAHNEAEDQQHIRKPLCCLQWLARGHTMGQQQSRELNLNLPPNPVPFLLHLLSLLLLALK